MTHEQDNQAPLPELETVRQAYADVLDHNSSHTGFGALFRGVVQATMAAGDFIDIDDNGDEIASGSLDPKIIDPSAQQKDIAESLSRGREEGEMSQDLTALMNEGVFTSIGIMLLPNGNHLASAQGEAVTVSELKPTIENATLFASFLASLRPEDVHVPYNQKPDSKWLVHKEEEDAYEPHRGTYELLTDVLVGVRNEIQAGVDAAALEDPDVRAQMMAYSETAMSNFSKVEDEYTRLGFTDKTFDRYSAARIEDLKNCIKYWGQGALPEYLRIGGRLDPAGKIHWFDGLQDRMVRDVDYTLSLQLDPRTQPLGHDVAVALSASLHATLGILDESDAAWANNEENRQLVTDSIERLKPYLG